MEIGAQKASSLRWRLLRQALLRRHRTVESSDDRSEISVNLVSRKAKKGFKLIQCQSASNDDDSGSSSSSSSSSSSKPRDVTLCYTLPLESSPKLFLTQRANDIAELRDLEFCNQHDIDNTGIVCQWPSEDVLAYFCLTHVDMFRSKRVIELGAGYGLAGLVIGAVTEASEVVISDGNPQVVNYIERNIEANSSAFGGTQVKPMMLHWNHDEVSTISHSFDLIVASDCTFFKECHKGLAQLVKCLLKEVGPCEAMFFSPKRGDSLDKFLKEIRENGLKFCVTERYSDKIWKRHQSFINGDDDSWPSYDMDHCYPILVRITR